MEETIIGISKVQSDFALEVWFSIFDYIRPSTVKIPLVQLCPRGLLREKL